MEKRNAGPEHHGHGQASTSSLIRRRPTSVASASAAGRRLHPNPSWKEPKENNYTAAVETTNRESDGSPSRPSLPFRIGGAPHSARSSPIWSHGSKNPPRSTTAEIGSRSSAVPQLKLSGINDPPALLAGAHDLRSGAGPPIGSYRRLDSVASNETYIRQVNAAPRRDTSPPGSSPPRHRTQGTRIASLSPRSSATPSGQARVLARSYGGDRFIAPVNSVFLLPPNDMGLIGRPFSAHERGRSGQIPSHLPLTSYLEGGRLG